MSPLVASVSFMNSVVQHYKMLSWNVRGLNSQAKQEDVRQVIHLFMLDMRLSMVLRDRLVQCLVGLKRE
jgi:hypothetical protein